jgi:hypothetical protein
MGATRDEGNGEVGDVAPDDVEGESGGKAVKVSLLPGEQARANLALLYGGTGRTFQPWTVTGPAERHATFSEG